MDSLFLDEEENQNEERLELRRYFVALKKRWWLIAIITIGITAPWLYYLEMQPPIYEVSALIRFKDYEGTDIDLTRSRTMELTSRSFAERVVAQLGLSMELERTGKRFTTRSQIFNEFVTTESSVAGDYRLRLTPEFGYELYLVDTDADVQTKIAEGFIQDIINGFCTANGLSFQLNNIDNIDPAIEVNFKIAPFRDAVKSFQSRIRIRWEDKKGTLMNLSLTDEDPVLAAEMTNRLAHVFINQSAGMKKETLISKRKIIEEQLKLAEIEFNESQGRLKRFQEQNRTVLTGVQTTQTHDLTLLDQKKEKLSADVSTLQALLNKKNEELGAGNGQSDPTSSNLRYVINELANNPSLDNNPGMLVVRRRLNDLEQSWKEIVQRTSPENLRAKTILAEIKTVHSQVEDLVRQELINLQVQLDAVKRETSTIESQIRRLPAQESKLSELTRDKELREQIYLGLVGQLQEAKLSEAVETENIQILDPAITPELPTDKAKKQKAAFGGIRGLTFGIIFVLLLEYFNKSVRTVDDIRKYLKLAVVGTIPQVDFSDMFDYQDSEKIKQIDQCLVTHDYSPTPIGEAYRSLRTNLMYNKEDTDRLRSLVITSNEPGDGKSFTAANLSITLAQLKTSVLLIDSDLRRGVLHNTFKVAKEPGFSNYLTDVVPLQSILNETNIPNLTMISCGSPIPNPSELLGSHQMQRFLDEVRRKFDLILFDTPPLNAATDAVVVGTQVDATVIVIRAGKTSRDLARSKLELYSSLPAKVLGVVLNGTTADMAHPGYSYYHY